MIIESGPMHPHLRRRRDNMEKGEGPLHGMLNPCALIYHHPHPLLHVQSPNPLHLLNSSYVVFINLIQQVDVIDDDDPHPLDPLADLEL